LTPGTGAWVLRSNRCRLPAAACRPVWGVPAPLAAAGQEPDSELCLGAAFAVCCPGWLSLRSALNAFTMLRKNPSSKPCPGGALSLRSRPPAPRAQPSSRGPRCGEAGGGPGGGVRGSVLPAVGLSGPRWAVLRHPSGVHAFGRERRAQGALQKGRTLQKLITRLWLWRGRKRTRAWDREGGWKRRSLFKVVEKLLLTSPEPLVRCCHAGEKRSRHRGCLAPRRRQSGHRADACAVSVVPLSQQKAPVCRSDIACKCPLMGSWGLQMIRNQKLLSSKNAKCFRVGLSPYSNFQISSVCLLASPEFCIFAAKEKYTNSLFWNN